MTRNPVHPMRPHPRRGVLAALAAVVIAGLPAATPLAADSVADRPVSGALSEAVRRHPLRTLSGERITLAELEGEVVVVNFWASWCAPCRKELPRLAALHQEIAQRGGRVLAISIDEELANTKRFVKRHQLTLPVCHDGPDGLARVLDLKHVPYTLVLDRSGAVAYASSGADHQALDALAAVTGRLIGGPGMARGGEGEGR